MKFYVTYDIYDLDNLYQRSGIGNGKMFNTASEVKKHIEDITIKYSSLPKIVLFKIIDQDMEKIAKELLQNYDK